MRLNPRLGASAIGFVDDDPRKRGMHAAGVKVLGSTEEIGEILDRKGPDEVIIAIPSAPGVLRAKVVAACRERDIPVRTLPTVFELLRGGVQLTRQLREVRVEDVLGRDPVVMELERVGAYLEDKIVMVTGAGGSVGAELCRQIARVRPKLLVLLDHAEDNLFRIDREMLDEWHFTRVEAVLADCKEAERMLEVMQRFKPDVVFHAAAYKHVPLMEANPLEAVRNNAIATRVTAEMAAAAGAERFVLISTDKAVNPRDRDGRLEGDGRVDRRGGRARPRPDPLRDRPLRQRAGVVGQRRADLPRPDREGRAGHRHASRDDPLLHDHSRGRAARDPGRRPRLRLGGGLRARDGRAGADPGSGSQHDQPRRLRARRGRGDRVRRPPPGREDPRGALQRRRACAADGRRAHRPRRAAASRSTPLGWSARSSGSRRSLPAATRRGWRIAWSRWSPSESPTPRPYPRSRRPPVRTSRASRRPRPGAVSAPGAGFPGS